MTKHHKGIVQSITPIATDIFKITLALETMPNINPGQFLNVKVPGFTLRRPFGISHIDPANKAISFCFQIRGDGTRELSKVTVGTKLDLLLPLGNGFPAGKYKKPMLIGGGIGVFPLLPAATNSHAFLGFRDKSNILLESDFRKIAKDVTIVTDGFVTDIAKKHLDIIKPDAIFACGPHAMLKAMQTTFANLDIPVYISLEERMACGFGACICCTVNMTAGHKHRVCCEGPVFLLNEVIL
jgi:dihydroorotate dehydrogenase electron transfer subunit